MARGWGAGRGRGGVVRFTITTHRRLPGVGLSLAGNWGNVRYADDAAAERAAKDHAGKTPHIIQRETIR